MKRLLTTLVILNGLIGSAGAVWADARSNFNKGWAAYKAGDYAEAVKWFRKAAEPIKPVNITCIVRSDFISQTSPMRNLTATSCLTIAVLLGSSGVSFALPPCPGSPFNLEGRVGKNIGGGRAHVGYFSTGIRQIVKHPDFLCEGILSNDEDLWKNVEGLKSEGLNWRYVGGMYNTRFHGIGSARHGLGTLIVSDGSHLTWRWKYEGEWRHNEIYGQGTITCADGSTKKTIRRYKVRLELTGRLREFARGFDDYCQRNLGKKILDWLLPNAN